MPGVGDADDAADAFMGSQLDGPGPDPQIWFHEGEMEGDIPDDGEILAEKHDVLGGADMFHEDGILAGTRAILFCVIVGLLSRAALAAIRAYGSGSPRSKQEVTEGADCVKDSYTRCQLQL